MTTLLLILVLLTLAAVLTLAVVVAAMLRSLTRLRHEVDRGREGSIDPLGGGLPVGTPAPPFEATALDGSPYTGDRRSGELRLVAFAHPGCPPCEDLVPELIGGCANGTLPPAIVVSRGPAAEQPAGWRRATDTIDLVTERGDDVARMFDSFVTPHVFVVTAGDRIGARGVATTIEDVRQLVARATMGPSS